jgi:hypothetical protein
MCCRRFEKTAWSRPSRTSPTGKYPVSRPLFFYVKKAHVDVIPGIKYLAEFTSEKAWGPERLSGGQGHDSDA